MIFSRSLLARLIKMSKLRNYSSSSKNISRSCGERRRLAGSGSALLLFASFPLLAQPASFSSIAPIPFDMNGPVIRAHAEAEKPFTNAGEQGVVLGEQNGVFEAWVLPVKLLSHMTIEADIEGYTVPIDLNQQAAEVEVRPDRTVITYSHIGFTVRQIMFSPDDAPRGTGPIVLYQFDCLHPTEFIFRFTPELRWMWPERNEGVPGVEWVAPNPRAPSSPSGFYVLHADYPDLAGAIAIPGAQPGILAPYQERPQVHPVEFHLHIDPQRDHGRLFPLLMAAGMRKDEATNQALGATLIRLNASIADLYKSHSDKYKKTLENSVSIETPDQKLNDAFQWAVVSIEQLKAHPVDAESIPTDETALVAGYYASGDSARPGFGWFFGRDSLYTLYAVDGYGDFPLAKSELEFLIRRQRDDGKIMHEYSQTAAAIDWRAFPYMYAAADSTPLFLLATADYVKASGDVDFLKANRNAIEKAWAFETDPAHDTDHDGIYDNSQGTGWVESWPGGMPHQEIYLALLDQEASAAMGYIESLLEDSLKEQAALNRAQKLAKTINQEYWDAEKNCYAFSRNMDGSEDRTSTVYPALAWWDPAEGKPILAHPDGCLSQFVSDALDTDWGLRDVADTEPVYDGMSYHQGSVWPLFTGWASLAEYRGGHPLAGYQLLMENANLTKAQDLGAVTELLSGDFFVPFGRSTSHQLWSSAMVITPILRGLFGISVDARTGTITVNPHLPAQWETASVKNLPAGRNKVDLLFAHNASGQSTVRIQGHAKLLTSIEGAKRTADGIVIPSQPVEIAPIFEAPLPGGRTRSARVLDESFAPRQWTLRLEGLAGSEVHVGYFLNDPNLKLSATGAELKEDERHFSGAGLARPPHTIIVRFPPGEGWKTVTVTLRW